jgi:hypothetical protein
MIVPPDASTFDRVVSRSALYKTTRTLPLSVDAVKSDLKNPPSTLSLLKLQ